MVALTRICLPRYVACCLPYCSCGLRPKALPCAAMKQPKQVEIVQRQAVLEGFFNVEKASLRFERYDGSMSAAVERMHLDRGQAAAVLLLHHERQEVLLVEQFRFAAWTKGDGWLTEIVAGKIDEGEAPEEAAKREVEEETGYRVHAVQSLGRCFTMPGGSSERIHLFVARIDERMRVNNPQTADADEDLRPVWVPLAEVEDGSACFRFPDAKTQIALCWLRAALLAGELEALSA